MRVLGIDPGTAIVGYAIVDEIGKKYQLIQCGCIYTDKSEKIEHRIAHIFTEISLLIELYKPDVAVVEELFFFKNNKTIISVAESRGVILLAATLKHIPVAEYTPLQVKMGISSYGRASKEQVQEMVRRLLGMKEVIKPDDAADAVAIAITHINGQKFHAMGLNTTEVKVKKFSSKTSGNKISLEEYKKLVK
ncbi:MAG: crossover junction endodeoxyribonuclease RuvC [Fusobacteria bacterium]|nr:crossover junction endodeoxyribonuclease RuvC [Fusobacteriota bacterium]